MVSAPDFMLRLREALEASWDKETAYGEVGKADGRASGQCYPTSWVVQQYYPATEIMKGKVWTGDSEEVHFWNALPVGDDWYHIDLSWQQFPTASIVREFVALDRYKLNDSRGTIHRCTLLLRRVESFLKASHLSTPIA